VALPVSPQQWSKLHWLIGDQSVSYNHKMLMSIKKITVVSY